MALNVNVESLTEMTSIPDLKNKGRNKPHKCVPRKVLQSRQQMAAPQVWTAWGSQDAQRREFSLSTEWWRLVREEGCVTGASTVEG